MLGRHTQGLLICSSYLPLHPLEASPLPAGARQTAQYTRLPTLSSWLFLRTAVLLTSICVVRRAISEQPGALKLQISASHSSRVLSNCNNSKYLCRTSHQNAPIPIFLYWNTPIFQLLPDNFLHSAATQTFYKSNVQIPKSKSSVTKLSPCSTETDLIWLQRLQQLAQLL